MTDFKKQKIVYLFGAGATHAELATLVDDPSEAEFKKKRGLLIGSVSDRVIVQARRNEKYFMDLETVTSVTGSLNIELLISLIESSRIRESSLKTTILKDLVRTDIKGILTTSTVANFYLHKALLELHERPQAKRREELIGLVSLNYDDVLDDAYRTIFGTEPNYSFSLGKIGQNEKIPLLKLHGSFSWDDITVDGRRRRLEIIPLGATKNYLHIPYNFIWSRALELLIQCDVLRVVGCSLSQNDIHLIDLLFKAHLEKDRAFEIQVIGPEDAGRTIQQNYGFFPMIKRLTEIEPPLIPELDTENPFKTWLKYKGQRMLKEGVKRTTYLRKIIY